MFVSITEMPYLDLTPSPDYSGQMVKTGAAYSELAAYLTDHFANTLRQANYKRDQNCAF